MRDTIVMEEEIEQIAQTFFKALAEKIEFKKASVQWLLGSKRMLVAAFGFQKDKLQSRLLRPLETDSLIRDIVEHQRLQIIPNTNDADNWEKQPETNDVNSWIGCPMVVRSETVGVVTLDHNTPGFYENLPFQKAAHIDQLCTQLGNDIQKVYSSFAEEKRFQTLQIHDRGLELILSIGKTMLEAASIGEVLNAIVSGAKELTHTDSGVIFLFNAERTEVIARFHPPGFTHPAPRLNNSKGITRTIIESREIVSIPDIETDARVNPELRQEYRSMYGIPLKQEDFVMGTLYLNGRTPRELTETEKNLLRTLVDQAVLAIQIKNSEAMYHAIPQFLLLKDVESRFRAANDSFCRSLTKEGRIWKEKDIIGKRDSDFYTVDRATEYVAADKIVIATKTKLEFDELHQSPSSDKSVWVHVVKTPVCDAENEVVGVQAIFWDVTHQKQMQEKWESLVQQSPDSIVVHEQELITFANSEALRLLNVSFDEIKGRSIFDFIDQSCHDLAKQRLDTLNNKEIVDQGVPMTVRSKSGEAIDVEVYSSTGPRQNEVQVVFHDLTRRKQLMATLEEKKRELENALKEKERLLQEAHHRIKNNLSTVSGLLFLQGAKLQDETAKRMVQESRSHVQAMAFIHEQLSRSSSPSSLGMRDYLSRIFRELQKLYRAEQMGIHSVCDLDDIELAFDDAIPCGLIVNELVTNAFKHAFPNRSGVLRVGLRVGLQDGLKELVSLYIADDGIGLPNNVEPSTSESLGMQLVYRWVTDELGGTLNTLRTNGTTFAITFRRR